MKWVQALTVESELTANPLSALRGRGGREVKMQFCSHLLCHFNLSGNLELSALENVEISDYLQPFSLPSPWLTRKQPWLCRLPSSMSLGTTLTCQALRSFSTCWPHAPAGLPSCPWQHWDWTPPSTHEDTQQPLPHARAAFSFPYTKLLWAPGGRSNISPGCVSQCHAHPHISGSVPPCSSLACPLGQRRPWSMKAMVISELSCHNPEPEHFVESVCSASLAVGNYIEKKIRISSKWNANSVCLRSNQFTFKRLHPRSADIHKRKTNKKKIHSEL